VQALTVRRPSPAITSALVGPDRPFDGPDRFENGVIVPGPHFDANCPGTEQASVVINDAGTKARPTVDAFFPGSFVVFN
jgi:hypothetical protein